jgi:hypothetical protein
VRFRAGRRADLVLVFSAAVRAQALRDRLVIHTDRSGDRPITHPKLAEVRRLLTDLQIYG